MGAFIFGGNYIVRRQFSGGKFSSGAIILGGNCPERIFRGQSSRGQLSEGQLSRGQFSSGAIVLEPNFFYQIGNMIVKKNFVKYYVITSSLKEYQLARENRRLQEIKYYSKRLNKASVTISVLYSAEGFV